MQQSALAHSAVLLKAMHDGSTLTTRTVLNCSSNSCAGPVSDATAANVQICTHSDFELLVMLLIFGNCISLAAYDPLEHEGGPHNTMLERIGKLQYLQLHYIRPTSCSPATKLCVLHAAYAADGLVI
jgi:hypothetical protein